MLVRIGMAALEFLGERQYQVNSDLNLLVAAKPNNGST
jgi:hypothetical protein